jgi:ribonucleotide reductase alpha subunit
MIDYNRDEMFGEQALKLLKDYYMHVDEKSPQEAFARAALAYSRKDEALAKRIYEYASKGWFMFASPVLSNAPKEGHKWKGLPISCFLNYVPDNLEGLIDHSSETRWLSVKGGGVGGHWSAVRSVSNVAPGPIPFIHTVDSDMNAYRQGVTRKGSYAAYLDVSHPDVEEFLMLRVPTGGDPNRKCFNIHNAINVTDEFMNAVINDTPWNLIDPHSFKIVQTIPSARDLWQRILETRSRTGEPYINFIDAANRHLPESQKALGLKIHGSNLCFPGDTLVALTNGEYVTIEELSKRPLTFKVKACALEDRIWFPVKAEAFSRQTGVQEVVEVILENGDTFECTAEHQLATFDGLYVSANSSVGKKLQIFVSDVGGYKVVTGIKSTGKVVPVYDLHVKDHHNFLISSKGGSCDVLVHNCNEIHLATNDERTAVCCLSSLNLEFFDEWKDSTIVEDLITMLDNVLQAFIDNCPDVLHKARYSAIRERSLGLGMMGFHSYLQRKDIPFESALASLANRKIFKLIRERAVKQSRHLAEIHGEPEDMKGTGLRNAHLLAIAPNANSSIILGCSPSIEPWKSNAYSHRTRAGTHLVKNVYLERLLEKLGKNTPEVWQMIILEQGSVQHLEFLTKEQKDVFKTAFELDQRWIIDHAATRQPFICQGQSVNLFFPSGTDRLYVNEVHLMAWKRGLKGLYYYRSSAERQADSISKSVLKSSVSSPANLDCMSCQS